MSLIKLSLPPLIGSSIIGSVWVFPLYNFKKVEALPASLSAEYNSSEFEKLALSSAVPWNKWIAGIFKTALFVLKSSLFTNWVGE